MHHYNSLDSDHVLLAINMYVLSVFRIIMVLHPQAVARALTDRVPDEMKDSTTTLVFELYHELLYLLIIRAC